MIFKSAGQSRWWRSLNRRSRGYQTDDRRRVQVKEVCWMTQSGTNELHVKPKN